MFKFLPQLLTILTKGGEILQLLNGVHAALSQLVAHLANPAAPAAIVPSTQTPPVYIPAPAPAQAAPYVFPSAAPSEVATIDCRNVSQ